MYKFLSLTLPVLLLLGCAQKITIDNRWYKDFNVCKKLKDDVLIYPVFVNDRKKEAWSKEKMQEIMDSLKVVKVWLEEEANKANVPLNIKLLKAPKEITKGLAGKSIKGTEEMLNSKMSLKKLNKHYDGIAKNVAYGIKEKAKNTPFVNRVKDKERLIAKLRNVYACESVVLIFMHLPEMEKNKHQSRNSSRYNIALTVNTLNNEEVEFMVNSYSQPSVLAYGILSLFGASNLIYPNNNKKTVALNNHVQLHFPKDIMANPFGSIRKYSIGAYTQNLIGWNNQDISQHKILFHTKVGLLK